MNRLRIAVVGAGRLGKIHARLLDGNEDVDLVAIVEPMHATREALGHDFSCRIAESTGEVIHDIDAAVIATPTMFHHRVGEELLQNGIHVFVEKPISSFASFEFIDAPYYFGVRSRDVVTNVELEILDPKGEPLPPSLYEIASLPSILTTGTAEYEITGQHIYQKDLPVAGGAYTMANASVLSSASTNAISR